MKNKQAVECFKKKHNQSKYFTIMFVPDATNLQVRSLKVPHRFMHMLFCTAIFVVLLICSLSIISAYTQKSLVQTAKLIEESEVEKESAKNAKKKIEKNLISQQSDFDKQIDLYMERILRN